MVFPFDLLGCVKKNLNEDPSKTGRTPKGRNTNILE